MPAGSDFLQYARSDRDGDPFGVEVSSLPQFSQYRRAPDSAVFVSHVIVMLSRMSSRVSPAVSPAKTRENQVERGVVGPLMHSLFYSSAVSPERSKALNAKKWAAVGGKKDKAPLQYCRVPNASNAALSRLRWRDPALPPLQARP